VKLAAYLGREGGGERERKRERCERRQKAQQQE